MDNENFPNANDEHSDINSNHNEDSGSAFAANPKVEHTPLAKPDSSASNNHTAKTASTTAATAATNQKDSTSSRPKTSKAHKAKTKAKDLAYFLHHKIKTNKVASIAILAVLVIAISIYAWFMLFNPTKEAIKADNQVVSEYRDKLPDLKSAVEKNPKDATNRRNYAVALYVIKDLNASRNQFEEAVKLDSKDATTYNNLGNVYRDLKDYSKAVDLYNKAIDLNKTYLNAYVNLAHVQLYSQNKSDDAIATYKKALKAMPNNDQVELLLGIAYESAGKTAEAKQTYQDILSRSPNNQAAKNNLDRLNSKK